MFCKSAKQGKNKITKGVIEFISLDQNQFFPQTSQPPLSLRLLPRQTLHLPHQRTRYRWKSIRSASIIPDSQQRSTSRKSNQLYRSAMRCFEVHAWTLHFAPRCQTWKHVGHLRNRSCLCRPIPWSYVILGGPYTTLTVASVQLFAGLPYTWLLNWSSSHLTTNQLIFGRQV